MASQSKYVIAGVDMTDLYPAPFPDDIPTAELQTISVAKLLSKDKTEAQRIHAICRHPGFFLLDLTDDPRGIRLLQDAADCARLAKRLFKGLTVEQKREYEPHRDRGAGVFDGGYFTKDVLPNGEVKYNEIINFPVTEMFGYQSDTGLGDFALPDWLKEEDRSLILRTMRSSSEIGKIVLSVLEQSLKIPDGELLAAHQLQDPSGDSLRLLRYPGYDPAVQADSLRFPAHTDSISLGLLFTWVGGLQLPALNAQKIAPQELAEESWRWVRPVPGTTIVNVGDALEVLTNKALTAGLHRVVRAPRSQAPHDRYSVLMSLRPANKLPMVPFSSPVIPPLSEEQKAASVVACAEWGRARLNSLRDRLVDREQKKEHLELKE